jgi:predicted HicB family RNase H-like nuclease
MLFMKNKRFNFRVTERRYEKLNLIAKEKEKSLASLFDDWIDSLPEPRKESITES